MSAEFTPHDREVEAARELLRPLRELSYPKPTAKKARAFDFDDTLIGRQRLVRFGGAIMGGVKPHHLPNLTAEEIAALKLNHSSRSGSIYSPKEAISFFFHSKVEATSNFW
jgi:hypothetical protein